MPPAIARLQRSAGNRAVSLLFTALRQPVVQRTVAFEAESKDAWKVSGKTAAAQHFESITGTKAALGTHEDGKLDIKSDSGNLEFVTRPLKDENEVKAVFEAMKKVLGVWLEHPPYKVDGLPQRKGLVDWNQVGDFKAYEFSNKHGKKYSGYDDAPFAPQATIDLPFSKVAAFLALFEKEQELVGQQLTHTTGYIKNTNLDEMAQAEVKSPAARGFLSMVLMALYDAMTFKKPPMSEHQDPKTAFALMPRNRFSEMYTAANTQSDGELARVFPEFAAAVTAARRGQGKEPKSSNKKIEKLFPHGYLGDSKKKVDGPSVQEWLGSILNPPAMEGDFKERKADLLSPPLGQRTKREGLGAYDLAGGKTPFFELRDFMSAAGKGETRTLDVMERSARALARLEAKLNEQE